MKKSHTTYGTCARLIDIETDGDRVLQVKFVGGCSGNAQGVSALVQGMTVSEVITRLRGIECRNGTSCPDQLARALQELSMREAG